MRAIRRVAVIVAGASLAGWGCGAGSGGGSDPGGADAPADVAGDASSDAQGACPCICGLPPKTAYRFTEMTCVPPASASKADADHYTTLCDLLNTIWKRDIDKGLQSVIYEIEAIHDCSGGGSGSFDVVIGSGGKRKPDGSPCPKAATDTCDGAFQLQDGYHDPFATALTGCEFESTAKAGGWQLAFHPGNADDPVLCAPGVTPPDGILFRQLVSGGRFATDCATVEAGHLSGCIGKKAALGLCLCNDLTYADCPRAPAADPATFCNTSCGSSWGMNFGSFVSQVVGIPVNCDMDGNGTLDDEDGWLIEGTFRAVRVPAAQYLPW